MPEPASPSHAAVVAQLKLDALSAKLNDAASPPDIEPDPFEAPAVSTEDLLAVFNLAKIGMTKGEGWRPAPKMAQAYRRVREHLLSVGALPR